jgi:hypothetical protein
MIVTDSNNSNADLLRTALLSGLFAAIIAAAATRAIEVFGPRFGSIMSTLPTTIIPASLGLCAVTYCYQNNNPSSNNNNTFLFSNSSVLSSEKLKNEAYAKLVSAMFVVSGGMLVNAIYLTQWKFWPERVDDALEHAHEQEKNENHSDQTTKEIGTYDWIVSQRRACLLFFFRDVLSISNRNIQIMLLTLFIALGIWLKCSIVMVVFVQYVLQNEQSRTMVFGVVCLCLQILFGIRTVMNDYYEKVQQMKLEELEKQKQQKEEEEMAKVVVSEIKENTTTATEKKEEKTDEEKTSTTTTTSVSWKVLCLRGTAAGIANAVCILLSSFSGIVSGVAATFPAIFTTIMVSLWFSKPPSSTTTDHGDSSSKNTKKKNLSTASIGPIILGSISVPIYAMSFALLVPVTGAHENSHGNFLAAVGAWLTAVCLGSFPASRFLERYKK